MDPKTLQLIIYAEQMVALTAKTIVDLKNVLTGSDARTIDDILDDADATYQSIINKAEN